jgi:protein-S-isoprenylcysteine O-methyltransferase Ste14
MQTFLPLLVAYGLWVIFVISWNVPGGRTVRTRGQPGSGWPHRIETDTVATPRRKRERLYELVVALGLMLFCLSPLSAIAVVAKLWTNAPLLEWVLVGVVAGGFAFCWWARLHLGRLWSASVSVKEGHRTVETGPYRWVRHPTYTGFIVAYAGIAILCATVVSLSAVTCLTIGLWLKARLEEQFLCEELGAEAYLPYKARTPMFVPRLTRLSDDR